MKHEPRDSFRQNYLKYRIAVERYLRSRGVSVEDCEDILQETFLRSLGKLKDEPDVCHLPYLLTVARNSSIDLYRRRKNWEKTMQDLRLEDALRDPELGNDVKKRFLVEDIVNRLEHHPASRFFRMYYQDGRKIHEIACETTTPMGTVASQIARMRTKLKYTIEARMMELDL